MPGKREVRRGRGARVVLALALATASLVVGIAPDGRAAPKRTPATSEWACDWGMYGRTLARTFSSDCPSPIAPGTVAGLRPAWTFRVPPTAGDQATFTASPAVVDGVVYIGGWNGVMYALDAATGDVRWEHATAPATGATYGPIVSSAAVTDVRVGRTLRRLVVFGAGPRLYALDAASGDEVWVTDMGSGVVDDPTEMQSSPAVWNDTVYVGLDVHNKPGEVTGGNRGGLLAFDVRTGALRWRYDPEAAAGRPPSGCGGVWGSPVVDPGAGRVYFGTANCPAVEDDPLLPMEEVTALDARTGAALWTFRPHQPAGQESYSDEDQDFGATPNLFVDGTGRTVLGAGSKDGSYYALDPETGAVLWNTKVADPAPGIGGFIGSPAAWGGRVFGATAIGSLPAYHAIDGATGELLWQGASAPSYGASAAVNGVVLAGALDATLKAFDADSGRVLWASPLLGAASSGPAVAGDMVFVGSGTSTSDACAKDRPGDAACVLAFDAALGQQGGVHAFQLAGAGAGTTEPESAR